MSIQSQHQKIFKSRLEETQHTEIDKFVSKFDGTENKFKLDVNSISIAVSRVNRHLADLAGYKEIILPVSANNIVTR